jgi:chemotaxis protein MotA
MDIATIGGIIFFLTLVFASVLIAEGPAGFTPFLNWEALLIVMGGTFCALLVNYPLKQVFNTFKIFRKVLTAKEENPVGFITTFINLSQKARTKGILSLQEDIKKIDDDFTKRGLQLVVDGYDQEFIRNMLETEIGFIRERHKVGFEIFNALGTYAPAFGIIGTVFGMILMLMTIKDVTKVPQRMALALAAAFFGLSAGYLLFLPMAGKLRRRSEEELFIKEIIIRGILLIQSGAAPSVIENNLKAYLEPAKRAEIKRAEVKTGT